MHRPLSSTGVEAWLDAVCAEVLAVSSSATLPPLVLCDPAPMMRPLRLRLRAGEAAQAPRPCVTVTTLRQTVMQGALDSGLSRTQRRVVIARALAGHSEIFPAIGQSTQARLQLADELLQWFDRLEWARLNQHLRVDGVTGDFIGGAAKSSLEDADLLVALWRAFRDAEDPLVKVDAALDEFLRQTAARSVFVIALTDAEQLSDPLMQAFLKRWNASGRSLTWLSPERSSWSQVVPRLVSAWPEVFLRVDPNLPASQWPFADLQRRADALPEHCEALPLCVSARSLEHLSLKIVAQVHQWVVVEKKRVALVPLDRLLARRVRALLERGGLWVSDSGGWALSTTAAASLVDRVLSLLDESASMRALSSVLTSAEVQSILGARTAGAVESSLRQTGFTRGWKPLLRHLQKHPNLTDASTYPWFEALAQWGDRYKASQTSSEQGRAVLQALGDLGVQRALTLDAAGQQVIDCLQALVDDLTDHTSAELPASTDLNFRDLFHRALDEAVFVDPVESPVRFVGISELCSLSEDAVILMGADRSRLPADHPSLLLDEGRLAALGIADRRSVADEQQWSLAFWAASGRSTVLALMVDENGDSPLSPWYERLFTLARLQSAPQVGFVLCESALLDRQGLDANGLAFYLPSASPAGRTVASPNLRPDRVPRRWRVSDVQALVECPYRFFVRAVLKAEPSALTAMETPEALLFGNALHRVMQSVGQELERCEGDISEAMLRDLLAQAGARELDRTIEDRPEYARLRERWQLSLRAIAADWCAWVQQGWRVAGTEKALAYLFQAEGEDFRVEGRLDRLDQGANLADGRGTQWAVIDYKTGSSKSLKDRQKVPGEDIQLPAYALMLAQTSGGLVKDAFYWSLRYERNAENEGQVGAQWVRMSEEVGVAMAQLASHFQELASGLLRGQALIANGSDRVCARCESRGICRSAAQDRS